MTRQNLFSDVWDGDNREVGNAAPGFLAAGRRSDGATLYELAPGTPESRMHSITGPRRCSSSSAAARSSGTKTASST